MTRSDAPQLHWYGCYDNGWQSAPLVPAAYAHPAKVSFGLAERIYRHMLAEGWLYPDDAVLDPFGGIGGFAFHALLYGMNWTGVELEPRFCTLAQENIDLWHGRYAAHMPHWGTARILQGDSRRLAELVGAAGGCVSIPPYAASNIAEARHLHFDAARRDESIADKQANGVPTGYGTTPGQLGALPAGDYASVVSSPPYASNTVHDGNGIDPAKLTGNRPGAHSQALTMAGYSAAVSSPPYASQQINPGNANGAMTKRDTERGYIGGDSFTSHASDGYGTTPGQLGSESSDTFWSAARLILAQTYAVLRPGAVAAFVTGDFVRSKQRVPFGEQWLALCGSVGFTPLAWAVAWKTADHGAQLDIFGSETALRKERVSFFRRLANAKHPEAAILNEDVIFVEEAMTHTDVIVTFDGRILLTQGPKASVELVTPTETRAVLDALEGAAELQAAILVQDEVPA